MHHRWIRAAAILLLMLSAACAPKQRIPLEVAPRPATLFVDGEALESIPDELELRSDRPHVLFFKRDGYRSQRVVLETVEVDGRPRLEPDVVSIELAPAARGGRELVIEPAEPSSSE